MSLRIISKNKFGLNIKVLKENNYYGTFGGVHLLKKIEKDFA